MQSKFKNIVSFDLNKDGISVAVNAKDIDLEQKEHKEQLRSLLMRRDTIVVSYSTTTNAREFYQQLNPPLSYDTVIARNADLHDLSNAFHFQNGLKEDLLQTYMSATPKVVETYKEYVAQIVEATNKDQYDIDLFRNVNTQEQIYNKTINGSRASKIGALTQSLLVSEHGENIANKLQNISINNDSFLKSRLLEFNSQIANDLNEHLYKVAEEKEQAFITKYADTYTASPDNNALYNRFCQHLSEQIELFNLSPISGKQVLNEKYALNLVRERGFTGNENAISSFFNGTSIVDRIEQATNFRIDPELIAKSESSNPSRKYFMQTPLHIFDEHEQPKVQFVRELLEVQKERANALRTEQELNKLQIIASTHDGKVPLYVGFMPTKTGRYSASISNESFLTKQSDGSTLSLNVHSELSDYGRACLSSPDDGRVVESDSSAVESRIAAALLGNTTLLDIYKNNGDAYLYFGMKMHYTQQGLNEQGGTYTPDSLAFEEPRPTGRYISLARCYDLSLGISKDTTHPKHERVQEIRATGKTAVLASNYGQGAAGLAQKNGYTIEHAKTILQSYRKSYPELTKFDMELSQYIQGLDRENQSLDVDYKNTVEFTMANNQTIAIKYNPTQSPTGLFRVEDVIGTGYPTALKEVHSLAYQHNIKNENFPNYQNTLEQTQHLLNKTPFIITLPNGDTILREKDTRSSVVFNNIIQASTTRIIQEQERKIDDVIFNLNLDATRILTVHDSLAYLCKDEKQAEQLEKIIAGEQGIMKQTEVIQNLPITCETEKISASLPTSSSVQELVTTLTNSREARLTALSDIDFDFSILPDNEPVERPIYSSTQIAELLKINEDSTSKTERQSTPQVQL